MTLAAVIGHKTKQIEFVMPDAHKQARSKTPGLPSFYAVLRNTNPKPTMINNMPSMLSSARRLPKNR